METLYYADFNSFGYITRSGITRSSVGYIPRFLRNLHIAFQSLCINLQPYQQCMNVPFSLEPYQHLLLLVFLIIAILTGVRWNLSIVLICIYLIAREAEHFSYICYSVTFLLLWSACSFPLLIGLFLFGC